MAISVDDIIRQGAAEGLSLSQIQEKLAAEGHLMTYMDLRFKVDDLGVTIAEKVREKTLPPMGVPVAETELSQKASPFGEEIPSPAGVSTVSVVADDIVRPGAILSGSVNFSDGQKLQWSLDEMGRLGLIGAPAGYKPTREDLVEMQAQLRAIVEKKGLM